MLTHSIRCYAQDPHYQNLPPDLELHP